MVYSGCRVWAVRRLITAAVAACPALGLACAIVLGSPVASATALARQDSADGSGPLGQPAPAPSGEVTLSVKQLGLGGRARAGEWTGIQVQVTSSTMSGKNVAIQVAVPDGDGDVVEYQTVVVPTARTDQSYWLYARLPFAADAGGVTLNITAYAIEDDTGGRAPRLGRRLGATAINTQTVASPAAGLMGIVGRSAATLELYSVNRPPFNQAPQGHEATELIIGLTAANLPDRWMGYSGLTALIWTGSTVDTRPTSLTPAQVQAIREYVERGGHFIVVLPTVPTDWIGAANPLRELMPRATIRRQEQADLNAFLPLLRPRPTGVQRIVLPTKASLCTFELDANAKPGEAMNIMQGPAIRRVVAAKADAPQPAAASVDPTADSQTTDSQTTADCVVARRLIGTGMVTLIGFDLTNPSLLGAGGLTPDSFWHRILGRRGELRTNEEINAQSALNRLVVDRREPIELDRFVSQEINKTGQAAAGVFLAFVVFGVYWFVAGPLGFIALRRKNLSHWAWVGFLASSAVFTVICWGGAVAIRPWKTEATHLTVLDHVYGQPVQRARMWATVLLPKYGISDVAIQSQDSADPAGTKARSSSGPTSLINAVAPWQAPASFGASSTKFADSRRYVADARRPDELPVPSRQTVKTLQIDWAGAPQWKMPLPVPPEGAPPGTPAEIALRERVLGTSGSTWYLDGRLRHDLPGDLKDVTVMFVQYQEGLGAPPSDRVLSRGRAFSVKEWKRGAVLDLAAITIPPKDAPPGQQPGSLLSSYFDSSELSPQARSEGLTRAESIPAQLAALSLFSQLKPPNTRSNQLQSNQPLYRREAFHGMDLSRWITQPCVIIFGHLGDRSQPAESPVPLTVDGKVVSTVGRTMVRWVYPLPDMPPRVELAAGRSSEPVADSDEPATDDADPSLNSPNAGSPTPTPGKSKRPPKSAPR